MAQWDSTSVLLLLSDGNLASGDFFVGYECGNRFRNPCWHRCGFFALLKNLCSTIADIQTKQFFHRTIHHDGFIPKRVQN